MDRVQHNRFKDAPWYNKQPVIVHIGGAGGIGSWTAFLLARAGFQIVVNDFDILEAHNIGGQLFPLKSIGIHKVYALEELIKEFSAETISSFEDPIVLGSMSNPISIAAFDNMEARANMYANWKMLYGEDPNAIFIDGRLNAEHMQILCVRGNDETSKKKYEEEYSFSDGEVEDAPCTLKQTSHAAAMIASHITGFLTNHITNVVEKEDTRAVPFYWEYFIPIDLLTQL